MSGSYWSILSPLLSQFQLCLLLRGSRSFATLCCVSLVPHALDGVRTTAREWVIMMDEKPMSIGIPAAPEGLLNIGLLESRV